ncbi:MAG: hypothetical protein HY263_04640 [Chloroflexi bacterium]|nr:hypothetical protein [Chloroflexota bacterium]
MNDMRDIEAGLKRHLRRLESPELTEPSLSDLLTSARRRSRRRSAVTTALGTSVSALVIASVLLGVSSLRQPSGATTSSPPTSAEPTNGEQVTPWPAPTGLVLATTDAIDLVARYEQALADGNADLAWAALSPGFRAIGLDSNFSRYTAERLGFMTSVGSRFEVQIRSADPNVLRRWALPRLTEGADLSSGYLIEAHYPGLAAQYPSADASCASDFYIVAADQTHTWSIWWVGDAAALPNGSCSRSAADYSSAP